MKLKDRVAIVTGAGSGIGLAIAELFAKEGAKVTLNDIDVERGASETARIKDAYGNCIFAGGDISKPESCRNLVEVTTEEYGKVDILVNNAGLQYVSPLDEFPEDKWELLLGVMLTGAFYCTKYAFPHMKRNKFGRVVNISSIHGIIGVKFKSAYVAAKHGLIGLTKVTALEGVEHGITANAVCPTFVRTPLVEKQIDAQAEAHGIPREEVIEKVILAEAPMKRMLEPEEVAELCLFLVGEAAKNITGAAIPIDEGWTAQ